MSVGIMDADLATYSLVPFNLEIMKLSAYYKKKGEIVILSPSFTPDRNTKFIYRKDYNDGDFPVGLTKAANVEYGGLAFSNNIYQPLPIEIEKLQPDTSIYERAEGIMMSAVGREREKRKIFQNMMTAEHCRLSLDGKTIWEDYPRQFKFLAAARNLMLHDYNLGAVDGGFETVRSILDRARTDGWATKVGMKFPVQVKEGQDLINWSSLNSNSTFYSLRFDGVMDDDTFNEWVGTCRQRAVYSQMEYHITAPWYEANEFIKTELPRIFRQVIISRSYRIFFSLKYDEGFFPDKRWEDVIRLFNYYHNSYSSEPLSKYFNMIANDTLFNFASNCQVVPAAYYGEVLNKDQIRELFAFVREEHYPLFKDFYECTAEKLGGKL
jgi:hypothetical protein